MEAIGILESNSIAKGIEAMDMVLKAADTRLLYARTVCPGKYTILFYGDVAAVQAAADAGGLSLAHHLVDSIVIPRIHSQGNTGDWSVNRGQSGKCCRYHGILQRSGGGLWSRCGGEGGRGNAFGYPAGNGDRRKVLCRTHRRCSCSTRGGGMRDGRGREKRSRRRERCDSGSQRRGIRPVDVTGEKKHDRKESI